MSQTKSEPLPRHAIRRAEWAALPLLIGVAVFFWTAPMRAEHALKSASFNDLRTLSRSQPDNPRVFYHLGVRLRELGQLGPAAAAFARAAMLDTTDEETWLAWGTTAAAFGRKGDAFEALTKCAQEHPDSGRAHLTLALFCQANSALQRAHDEALAATRCDARDTAAWRLAGVTSLELRDLPGAESALMNAVRLTPRDWRALLALGRARAAQHRPAEALEAYDRASKIAPEEPAVTLAQGEAQLAVARTDVEIEAARVALANSAEKDPGSADAHFALGQALARLRRWPEAQIALTRAVRLRPSSSAAHFELARVYRQLGDAPAANRETAAHAELKDYEEERLNLGSQARTGNNPAVRLKLARLCAAHGDYRAAILAYRTLLIHAPGEKAAAAELARIERAHPEARPEGGEASPSGLVTAPQSSEAILLRDAASVLARGRLPEAERAYLQIIRSFPRSAKAFEGLGLALNRQSKTEEAFRALDRALKLDATLPEAQFALARLYFDQGFIDEAARRMEVLTRQAPSNPEYLHAFAVCILDDSSRYLLAEQVLERAVALDARQPSYWRDLGRIEGNLNRLGRAETAYRKALVLAPNDSEPAVNLGTFLLDHRPSPERQAEAELRLQRVVAREPGNAVARLGLGRAALAKGRASEAVRQLQTAVSRDPNLAQAWYHLARAYDRAGDSVRAQDCRAAFGEITRYRKELSETEERARYSLKDPNLRLKLARLYARGGQNARAINQYQVCLSLAPNLSAARAELTSLAARLQAEGRLPSMNALNGMLLASVKAR